MTVIGWFACKSLSDWVRYLVIVTCTGKSRIFRGQPVSLRGSNPDYSGRSTSRVKKGLDFGSISHNFLPKYSEKDSAAQEKASYAEADDAEQCHCMCVISMSLQTHTKKPSTHTLM